MNLIKSAVCIVVIAVYFLPLAHASFKEFSIQNIAFGAV